MEARDLLTGRKVDAERGCVLKAEMAKKNLHTKRGLSNNVDHSVKPVPYVNNFRRRSAPETNWDPYAEYNPLDRANSFPNSDMFPNPSLPSPSIMEAPCPLTDVFDPFNRNQSFENSETGDFEPSLPAYMSSHSRGFSSVLYNSDALLAKNMSSLSISAPSFDPMTSYSNSFTSSSPSLNGMDQNPPCNTLYVGNIPNETSEEELVALFSPCPGYKRLSFKSRSNGPMCFVEVYVINSV